jgi:hypothetical protein
MFLVTGPDQDPQMGRGVGKSHMPMILSQLVGGTIDVSPRADIEKIKTRLLSPGATGKRIAMLDNLKTTRFSWGELEGLIPGHAISGHAMYQGEGSRPNTLTWCVTVNGASLSKDMAQRSVTIKLARPRYDPTWEQQTRDYISRYRWEIISDIGRCLELPSPPLATYARWNGWEQAVLSRLANPAELQRVILERQGAMDDDDQTADLVGDHIAQQLAHRHINPDTGHVFLRLPVLAEWLSQIDKECPATKVTPYLRQLSIPQLSYNQGVREPGTGQRGWVWRGPHFTNEPLRRL